MISYRIINKQGSELASVLGSTAFALATALNYYHQYLEDGENVKLVADKKTLIDYKEAPCSK